MKVRRVIITIDTLMELFKDYCSSEDIPASAQARKLMLNQQERKAAVVAESPEWAADAAPLQVNFQIKRYYGV